MITEKIMFTVICDNCGADACEGTDYSCWGDKGAAEDVARDDGWEEINGGHYCPKCFCFDDEDNLIIKKKIE